MSNNNGNGGCGFLAAYISIITLQLLIC